MDKNKKQIQQKTQLFAERAVVLFLAFNEARVIHKLNNEVARDRHYQPKQLVQQFMRYLDDIKVGYALIDVQDDCLLLALPRHQKDATDNLMDGFFKNGGRAALSMSAVSVAHNPHAALENTLLKPFSKLRRDVEKSITALNRCTTPPII